MEGLLVRSTLLCRFAASGLAALTSAWLNPSPRKNHTVPQTCIHDLLQHHAATRPRHHAFLAPGREPLGYRDLYQHVIGTAAILQSRSVNRGHRVAVVLPDSAELASAILAVSSLTVCAPLNPHLRLAEYEIVLRELNANAVLLAADHEGAAPDAAAKLGITTIVIRPCHGAAAGLFTIDGALEPAVTEVEFTQPGDVALLLHTSGTTAVPKQVALTQVNICRSALNIAASLSLGPHDRCLNVMPLYHVHGLIGALLASLAAGSSVILPGRFDAPRIHEHLAGLEPTWFTGTPTILGEIAERAAQRVNDPTGARLRFVRSASAPLPERLRRRIEEQFGVPVIEAYGMTEASHQIATNPLPPAIRKPGSVGLAAGPLVAIHGEDGRPLPAGRSGEIVIRGDTVITAYAGDGQGNAESFRDGWLRTGDLGYLDKDGYLFIDGRVKEVINRGGEKISPPEIESVLNDHPMVADSCVFGVPDPRLGEDIAAWVVLAADKAATPRQLQEFAAARLADFKIPRYIAFTDRLPRTRLGKLERHRAQAMFAGQAPTSLRAQAADLVAPNGATERQVAEIWRTLLGVERVGATDNFFALGGDSIQAVMAMAAIRKSLGAELSIVSFFNNATVRQLAHEIDQAQSDGRTDHCRSPGSGKSPDSAPLSHTQQLIHAVSRNPLIARSAAFNRLSALRISGPLDIDWLRTCIDGIVARHALLRGHLVVDGEQASWTIRDHRHIEIECFDLVDTDSALQLPRLRSLAIDFGNRTFNLERGPLIRFCLVQLGAATSILLVGSHVLVFDGWSMRLFLRELTAHYQAVQAGQVPEVPELPIQYTDFARWQAEKMRAGDHDNAVAYWKAQLARQPPQVNFDRNRWTSPSNRFELRSHTMQLDEGLTGSLRELARRRNVTLYMVMLAALTVVLARFTDQDDVVVLSQSVGRNREEIQNLLGNFVTTLPLRCHFGSEQSFIDHLDGIRQICLEAWDHEEAPFASLITQLYPGRDLLIDPISPLLFVYKNFSMPAVTVGQTTFEVFDLEYQCEPFGLILKIFEETASLSCHFLHNEAVVSHTQAGQLAACYTCVLRQVANNPHIPLGRCLTTRQLIRTLGLGPVLAHAFKALTTLAGCR